MRRSGSFTSGSAIKLALAGGGALLAGLSLFKVIPLALVAVRLSPDGQISAAMAYRFAQSQLWLGILLIAAPFLVMPFAARIRGWMQSVFSAPLKRYLLLQFLAGLVFSLLMQQVLLEGIPHVTDETSHVFQSKLLAQGRLQAEAPPCPVMFYQHNTIITEDGRWHTKYFPGQALWLALFRAVGLSALAMPVAFGFCALFIGYLFSIFWGKAGRAAATLFLFSPSALLLGGSHMSHVPTLMCSSGAIVFFLCAMKSARVRIPLLILSGVLCGLGTITRPHDQLLGFLFLGLAWLTAKVTWKQRWFAVAVMVVGFLLPLGFLFYWNTKLYGSMVATGYVLNGELKSITPLKSDSLGFSHRFSLAKAFINLFHEQLLFHKSLLGWPTSFLFLPFAFFRWDRSKGVVLLGATAPIVMYFFFPYYAFEYESRYYLFAIPFLLLLTVFGFQNLPARARVCCPAAAETLGAAALTAVVISFAHAALFYWPSYIVPRYGDGYEYATPRFAQAAKRAGLGKAVVMVYSIEPDFFQFSSGFVYNDPDLENDVIFSREPWIQSQVECLKTSFPDRTFYRFIAGATPAEDRLEEVRLSDLDLPDKFVPPDPPIRTFPRKD